MTSSQCLLLPFPQKLDFKSCMNWTETPLCILFYRRGGAVQKVCPNFHVYSFFLFLPREMVNTTRTAQPRNIKKNSSGQNAEKNVKVPVKVTKQRAGQGEGLVEVFREKTRGKGRKDASDDELRSQLWKLARRLHCLLGGAPNLDCLPWFLGRDHGWGQLVAHTSCQGSCRRDSSPGFACERMLRTHWQSQRCWLPFASSLSRASLYFFPGPHPLTFLLLPRGILLPYASSARWTDPWFSSQPIAPGAYRS